MIGQHGNSLLEVILNKSDTYLCQLNQNATTPQIARLVSVKLFKTKREKLISTKVRNQTNNQLLHFGSYICIILIQNNLFSESDNVQKRN